MKPISSGKARAIFIGSVALNIFLIAFILGRVSMMGMMPPPPPPPPFAMGDMPPPPPEGAPPPPFAMGGHMLPPPMGGHMPPPPFFAPADLFSPEEMHEGFEKMHENFTKIEALRQDFARQLQQGSVTKEQALAHFAQVDQVMDSVKKEMQEKAAQKISVMTPEERQRFADRVIKKP